MIIDRARKITHIAAILSFASAIIGIFLLFRSFSSYLFFMTLINGLLAYIFYRGTSKDRECLIAIYGFLALYPIIQLFSGGNLSISGGLFFLFRIGGAIAILSYLLAQITDKRFPLIGAIAITLANLWSCVQLILSFKNLGNMLNSFGGGLSSGMILNLCLSLLTVLTYTIPVVITAVLVAVDAIKIQIAKGGNPVLDQEKETLESPQDAMASTETSTTPSSDTSTAKPFLFDLKNMNKKVLAAAGVIVVAIIAVVIIFRTFFSPINKFAQALNRNDIAQAQEIFEENLHDDKFSKSADEKLENYLTSVKESYINDKSTYEEAQEAANAVDPMMSVQNTLDLLKVIADSKSALKSAEDAEASADFYKAIENYEKISPEDTKDYAMAEERIAAAKASLVSKALDDAVSFVQAGNHTAAINTLTAVQKAGYATPEIESALLDAAEEMIQVCNKPEDYYTAYEQIKKIDMDSIPPLLNQAISAASVVTVSEAQDLIAQQKYIDAFEVLSLPKGDFVTFEIESALKNCTTLAADAILAEVNAMKANGQYKEAYELLCDSNSMLLTDMLKTEKDECENLYKQSVLDSAAQMAGQGDYDGAIAVINAGQKLLRGQDLKDKIEEYRLEKLKSEQLVTVESTKVRESFIYNEAVVVVKNRTDKVLKEYSVAIIMLDSNGYPVNNTYSHKEYLGYKNVYGGRADSVNLQPGETYGRNSYWNIEGDCDKIMACVVSAEFYDGTSWTNPYLEPWLKAYAEKPIN